MTQIMPKFHLAFGGAGPFARLGEHRSPRGPGWQSPFCKGIISTPTQRGRSFSVMKSRQKNFI